MNRLMAGVCSAAFLLAGWMSPAGAQNLRKIKMTIPVVAHSMAPV